jgi:hypothetical protein
MVIMYYDVYKAGFAYYSNKNGILRYNSVVMKYVQVVSRLLLTRQLILMGVCLRLDMKMDDLGGERKKRRGGCDAESRSEDVGRRYRCAV